MLFFFFNFLHFQIFRRFGDLTYDAGSITFNFAPLIGLMILYFILRVGMSEFLCIILKYNRLSSVFGHLYQLAK